MTDNRYAGFTLIEVLVSLIILSVGLLGLALLQVRALQANTGAVFRTQASLFAYEIIDRMRANQKAAGAGAYHVPDATSADTKKSAYATCKASTCDCDAGVVCDSATLALYHVGKWYEEQGKLLPASAVPSTITQNGGQYTIVIRWNERELAMQQEWIIEL